LEIVSDVPPPPLPVVSRGSRDVTAKKELAMNWSHLKLGIMNPLPTASTIPVNIMAELWG
jgi:hypothetical protein